MLHSAFLGINNLIIIYPRTVHRRTFFLLAIYPFMKRYTYFPQVILGAAWFHGQPLWPLAPKQAPLSKKSG